MRKSILILAGLLAFNSQSAWSALQTVEQKVLGMDCAPCAFATEKGLKNLSGVEDVDVSLNKGTATVKLRPDNSVTIGQIREVIKDSGFSPVGAQVEVVGKLKKEEGKASLVTEEGIGFQLESDQPIKLSEGAQVLVKGEIPKDDNTKVIVQSTSPVESVRERAE